MNSTTSEPTPPPPLPTVSATGAQPGAMIDALLKRPAAFLQELSGAGHSRYWFRLTLLALLGFILYGGVVGAFSGGTQWWAAPVKVGGGALLSALICFPSLYIFTCLTGADVSLRGMAGVLAAILTLTGLLLLGFAPVAWVFSQSTESVAFIGTLHLFFWTISAYLGLRLLSLVMKTAGSSDRVHFKVWTFIFVLVCLQMTTALRPIVGTAPTLLPKEKKFFLAHWTENLSADAPAGRSVNRPDNEL